MRGPACRQRWHHKTLITKEAEHDINHEHHMTSHMTQQASVDLGLGLPFLARSTIVRLLRGGMLGVGVSGVNGRGEGLWRAATLT